MPSTPYTVTIAGVEDNSGTFLAAPCFWSFTVVDTILPAVASVVPGAGATGVSVDTTISVTFREPVLYSDSDTRDMSSPTTLTFGVSDGPGSLFFPNSSCRVARERDRASPCQAQSS
ncbi:MAG: Ig-like domain-containing protein [Methanospirillum sp.]|nr:Ig-like domain-containing protein [Methanospirillum sp.]